VVCVYRLLRLSNPNDLCHSSIGRSQSQRSKRSLLAIAQGLEKAFEFAGKDVPTCKYHLINRIPFARGYGEQCPLALEWMP
jgi:hypothetical protein